MAKRLLYYWSKTYVGDLRRGQDYAKLDKTIAILITATNLPELEEIKEYHSVLDIKIRKHKEIKIMEDFEIHIIELDKFNGGNEQPEDNWLRFIKGEEMYTMEKMEKEIKEARKEARREIKQEIVLKMHKRGMSVEEICYIVDISKEQIKEIIEGKKQDI